MNDYQTRYKQAATATAYTTDPDTFQRFLRDVRLMWCAWDEVEFAGRLRPPAIICTDDTFTLFGGGVLGVYCVSLHSIALDTTANLMRASCTGRTLYRTAAETLLHEMCHQWCAENGIPDTEPEGTYHNALFRDVARAHGLVCHVGTQGWNSTRVRRGRWQAFYDALPPDLARRMRTTHIPCAEWT